jgi:hypothetical protein
MSNDKNGLWYTDEERELVKRISVIQGRTIQLRHRERLRGVIATGWPKLSPTQIEARVQAIISQEQSERGKRPRPGARHPRGPRKKNLIPAAATPSTTTTKDSK